MGDEVSGSESGTDPGRMLQEARTRLGLSVAEVSERLKLAPRQVVAIENGDFESLPEATYVRGYLRNYAQLTGLPADAVLMAYSRRLRQIPEPPPAAVSVEPPPGYSDREQDTGPYALWVAALFIIALIGGGWYWHEVRSPRLRSVQNQRLTAPRSLATRGLAPVYAPTVTLPPNVPAPRHRTRTPLALLTPSAPPPPRVAISARASGIHRPAASTSAGAQVRASHTQTAVPRARSALATPSNHYGHVTLRPEYASDVEIRDATQMVLLNEHLPAGQRVTLNGVPPFTISLSDARGAHVRYDGRLLDLRRFRTGNAVRVVVGAHAPKQP